MTWSVIEKMYALDGKVNPAGHAIVDNQINMAGKSGEKIGHAIGWNWLENHGKAVQENRAQGVQDAAVVAAAYFTGGAALGAEGAGAAGAAEGASAAGAAEGAGGATAAGSGWVSGESLGETAGSSAAPAAEWTSGESLPSGNSQASNGSNWRDNIQTSQSQQNNQSHEREMRRQALLDRARDLRQQIDELRQQIASEDSLQKETSNDANEIQKVS